MNQIYKRYGLGTVARMMLPINANKGFKNPKILKIFSSKEYPLHTPFTYNFCENGFQKIVQLNIIFVSLFYIKNIEILKQKKEIWEITKPEGSKDLLALVATDFQEHLRTVIKNEETESTSWLLLV